jgi:two-component system response regulator RegA
MMTEPTPSILVVDDDTRFRDRLCRACQRRGYETLAAANFEEGLQVFRVHRPELAVVDLRMPGRSGLDLIREAAKVSPASRIVVLTGYGSIATAIEAVKLGAVSYLTKPADADEIIRAFAKESDERPVAEFTPPSLARLEWEHINRVMADCNNNISEAARRLGLHRRTLQRKLQKFPPRG